MKINVKVKLRSKEEKIDKIDDYSFVVWTKESPVEGRANRAIIGVLAEHFNVAPVNVRIVSGYNSKHKIIEIE